MRSIIGILALMAAAASGEERLELDRLVAEALERNPEILAAQKRYEAARQRPRQTGSLPDPMVSLGYNSNGSPRPFAGIGREPTSNAGFMFSQEFPYPGKRKLRSDLALKEAEAELQEYQMARLSVAARAKQAFHKLHHTYAVAGILERSRAILEQLLRITEIRYSVGKAAQQDVFKAQTQLSILEARRAQIERDRRSLAAEINSLLYRPPGAPVARPADVPLAELPPKPEDAPADSPLLRREEKKIESAQVAVNLARKDFYPDTSLTGGYFYMGAMPDMYMFRADVRIPLHLHKQRAAVTEKVYSLSQTKRSFEATRQELVRRINDEYLTAETASRLMKLYSQTVIPQANLALESSLASYETGGVDFLSVLNNHAMAVEYEMNYNEEMEKFWVALARLEEMTGR